MHANLAVTLAARRPGRSSRTAAAGGVPPASYSSSRSGRGWPIEPTSETSRANGRLTVQSSTARTLRNEAGDLAQVVGAGHPPGEEAREACGSPIRPTAL